MNDNKIKEILKENNEFNKTRTNIFVNIVFQIIVTIFLGLIMILVTSSIFRKYNFNLYNIFLDSNYKFLYLFIIIFIYLLTIFLLSWITILFKIQKNDIFSYSFGIAFAFSSFLVLNEVLVNFNLLKYSTMYSLVNFIVIIFFSILGIMFGSFISVIFRNISYK